MDRPVVLGLGSNKGDSRGIILEAITALDHILDELRRASLYESDPLYVTNQNRFINTAVAGFYPGTPGELLAAVQEIEARFGRDRSREQRWGERPLDIDILLFGDLIIDEQNLQIPHPRLKERRFALEPLLELMPGALEPGTGISYQSIRDALPAQGVKSLYALGALCEP
jgi:2-amino-4-hydroxy-6-hydroxymethyldihydropteridine diphosphokinase